MQLRLKINPPFPGSIGNYCPAKLNLAKTALHRQISLYHLLMESVLKDRALQKSQAPTWRPLFQADFHTAYLPLDWRGRCHRGWH